jgi:hypothetical protein
MTNYEQMTDKELCAEIAERLGWTFEVTTAGRNFNNTPVIEYIAIDPDGYKHRSFAALATSQESALAKHTPNWPRDANAALELLFPDVDDLEICFHDHTLTVDWFYAHDDERFTTAVEQRPASVARAICICWLRWQDAKGKAE